ncbi:MAG: alanine racemase [Chitinophagales bacterium]
MVRHSSRIELSQSALKKNINFIHKKIGQKPRICSVVKANAYGHGTHEFVPMAEKCGIDYFATSSSFEAEEVLEVKNEKSDIIIMGILHDEDIDWTLENGIEFYVFDYNRLALILQESKKTGKKAKIHLEVETGTNRTGMNPEDVGKSITFLKKHSKHFELIGVCSHLGGAESFANRFRIDRQIKVFNDFKRLFKKRKYLPKYFHLACSAAALAWPETILDMVRIGISQYGFWPSPEIYYDHLSKNGKKKDSPLFRVITWKTNVMDIKQVRKDDFVGYGTAFQAYQDMQIAVLPLGYTNGYSRNLSNKGFVLIKGKKSPIVGLVNMNLFMVDVSHIKNVVIGDEVVLIGKQQNNTITVSSFSSSANLINNEMIARLPAAIPRKPVR